MVTYSISCQRDYYYRLGYAQLSYQNCVLTIIVLLENRCQWKIGVTLSANVFTYGAQIVNTFN